MRTMFAIALLSVVSITAAAQNKETIGLKANCLPAAELNQLLKSEGQTRVAVAHDSAFQHLVPVDGDPFSRGTMVLYRNKGRFTVVFYYPEEKMSCVMISGFGMKDLK